MTIKINTNLGEFYVLNCFFFILFSFKNFSLTNQRENRKKEKKQLMNDVNLKF